MNTFTMSMILRKKKPNAQVKIIINRTSFCNDNGICM